MTQNAVSEYLTKLESEELRLEINSGSTQAIFVLGMNILWSSNHTTDKNPALNFSLNHFGSITALDNEKLELARSLLWEAGVNDISISLLELSATYSINFLPKGADYQIKKTLKLIDIYTANYYTA